LAIPRAGAVEHLRNDEDGVAQSWTFDHRPRGTGDLTVRVHVRGQRHAGESEHGHHFIDDATGRGVRCGN
jgi:hypothetical protein